MANSARPPADFPFPVTPQCCLSSLTDMAQELFAVKPISPSQPVTDPLPEIPAILETIADPIFFGDD